MKRVILLVAFIVTTCVTAQTGFIDSEGLLSLMPELKTVDTNLSEYSKVLQDELLATQAKINNQFEDLKKQAQVPNITEERKTELGNLYQTLEATLQREAKLAEMQLAARKNQLMDPVFSKLDAAIKKVAQAQGYSMIVDITAVRYATDAQNITLAVKKELGIE